MEWHLAYDKIRPYLVRVDTEKGHGSGFLFAYTKDRSVAAIATAAHVVADDVEWQKPIKIRHYESGTTGFYGASDRVIWIDTLHDGATILIKSETLPLPRETLPLIPADKIKRIGVEVGWVGFPTICHSELCFFSGKISAYLDDSECYLVDGVAINGVSGGPMFKTLSNDTPELIGMVSSYMPSRQTVDTLPGLLRVQDLSSAYGHIQRLHSFDEAKETEAQQAASIKNDLGAE